MLSIVASLCCCFAAADPELQGYFSRFDQNNDGRISVAEYQSKLSYAFHQLDLNGNNVLEVDEQPGNRPKRLTLQEHHARLAAQFRKQDRNRNGFLDLKELAAPPR
jgi:Ca2+-binding EF-hand superfamily protein